MKQGTRLTRISFLGVVLVILFCGFEIVSAVISSQDSGILVIVSSDQYANLSVSQAGYNSVNVGNGSARVRLKPGVYQVTASDNKDQAVKTVRVSSKATTTQNITPVSTATAASIGLSAQLPYEGPDDEYVIASPVGSPATLIITAATPQARQDALQWIRNGGFDPSNYNIQFMSQ